MAFNFEDLTPEARRAAFAHMDAKRLGKGARHKKLSAKKKAAVEHQGRGKVSGKLGSGSVKGQLSAADRDSGSMGGKLPVAKARPATSTPTPKLGPPINEGERARLAAFVAKRQAQAAASPDDRFTAGAKVDAKTRAEVEARRRFDKHFTDFMHKTTKGRSHGYASMVEVRKELDARGMPRAEQDTHLKRMSREGKLHIVPEDNRKVMTQADHDAAIRIGGEPNDHVILADNHITDRTKMKAAAKPKDRYTGPKNLSEKPPASSAELAKQFVEQHGEESVAPRIAFLEKKTRLLPGERAQLAALKTLDISSGDAASPEEISKRPLSKSYLSGKPTPEDQTVLANRYLLMHGDAGVRNKILQLEGRKRLSPGDRAQLAALRALKRK